VPFCLAVILPYFFYVELIRIVSRISTIESRASSFSQLQKSCIENATWTKARPFEKARPELVEGLAL
jgi:hypothetical protein